MEDLISRYKVDLNLKNATFSRIDHEDAMVSIVYKITLPAGEKRILKISERTSDYLRELYFLRFFSDKLPVPQIIQAIPPEDGRHGAILMEYFPGTLLNLAELTNEMAYEVGSILAKIHLNRMVGYGDPIQADKLNSDPRIYFTFKFEEAMSECKNHLPKALLEKCQHYYDTNIDLLSNVDGPCVVHRDFRPGNIMAYNGKIQGVIDWAGARASFAEEDFCLIEHREWSSNPIIKKSFFRGYENIRPIPNYTALMPLLRLNRAIAAIGFTVKRGTWNNSAAKLYQHDREFIEKFL